MCPVFGPRLCFQRWADYRLRFPFRPADSDTDEFLGAFPDLKVTTDFLVAEGDKVVHHWTATGTHKGELVGIPATGKQIEMTGIAIVRIAGGKIAELWMESDQKI